MAIPTTIERKLGNHVFHRTILTQLDNAFLELGISSSDPFREFYTQFQGPFASNRIGYELLDLIEQEESILSNTRIVRTKFDFPQRYVVLTSMNGHAILVYDIASSSIFDMDFEGGDKLLIEGRLPARWHNWWEFANDYFS